MAANELQNILSSGALTQIFLNGTTNDDRVVTLKDARGLSTADKAKLDFITISKAFDADATSTIVAGLNTAITANTTLINNKTSANETLINTNKTDIATNKTTTETNATNIAKKIETATEQYFVGDGVNKNFTVATFEPTKSLFIFVYVGGVYIGADSYTTSGGNLILLANSPSNGAKIIIKILR